MFEELFVLKLFQTALLTGLLHMKTAERSSPRSLSLCSLELQSSNVEVFRWSLDETKTQPVFICLDGETTRKLI